MFIGKNLHSGLVGVLPVTHAAIGGHVFLWLVGLPIEIEHWIVRG
jgi:hypothetical protein